MGFLDRLRGLVGRFSEPREVVEARADRTPDELVEQPEPREGHAEDPLDQRRPPPETK